MADKLELNLEAVYESFECEGAFVSAAPYGNGHINDTYAVVVDRGSTHARYVLQRINSGIFKDVPSLMENIERVCSHAQARSRGLPDAERRSLTLMPTRNGSAFHQSEDGGCWRVYKFIEGAKGFNVVENHRQAFEAAKAFGEFQKLLVDLPGGPLHETIPDFHNTPKRLLALEASVRRDARGRAVGCRDEIDWAFDNAELASSLLGQFESGLMPLRVTHNDTKLNNVLIDNDSHEAVCVIDLDTMMPGLALYDFGDLVRSSTNPVAEDEKDLRKVKMQIDCFDALVKGYLSSAREFLVPAELESMALSALVLTFECGIRFLADHLDGDVYFKTAHEQHNLERCRAQFALARSMVEQMEAMEERVLQALRQ